MKRTVQALKIKDFSLLGELLFKSHKSLRDDYEVSCPELDLLYDVAKQYPGCLRARLTGAGFGGSGIALVKEEEMIDFKEELMEKVQEKGFMKPEFYSVEVGDGMSVTY